MMMCSKCGKRPAVVYVSTSASDSDTKGYCLVCAKEMGIKPVTDIMEKMGISEEDLTNMQSQMDELMESGLLPDNMEEMEDMEDFSGMGDEEEDENFSRGGAPVFPFLKEEP